MTDEVELWKRDVIEVVQELLENTTYGDKLVFAPQPTFLDANQTEQSYGEMWTGEWWLKIQVSNSDMCLEGVDRQSA